MSKIAKYERKELERVLEDIGRAIDFITRGEIAICRRGSVVSTTLHYTRCDGRGTLYEIEKRYGSKLASLWQAENNLRIFLEGQRGEDKNNNPVGL